MGGAARVQRGGVGLVVGGAGHVAEGELLHLLLLLGRGGALGLGQASSRLRVLIERRKGGLGDLRERVVVLFKGLAREQTLLFFAAAELFRVFGSTRAAARAPRRPASLLTAHFLRSDGQGRRHSTTLRIAGAERQGQLVLFLGDPEETLVPIVQVTVELG